MCVSVCVYVCCEIFDVVNWGRRVGGGGHTAIAMPSCMSVYMCVDIIMMKSTRMLGINSTSLCRYRYGSSEYKTIKGHDDDE